MTVRDGGTPARSATQTLVVQVVDVNDERPQFDRSSYNFHVTENCPLGTVVGSVHALDADVSPAFNRVTYSLSQVQQRPSARPTSSHLILDEDEVG